MSEKSTLKKVQFACSWRRRQVPITDVALRVTANTKMDAYGLFGGCGAQLLETPFTKTKDENISTTDLIPMTETISQEESADDYTYPAILAPCDQD